MILYVNGDSHTAGAEAVNLHAFAEDDPDYNYLGRRPHPDNLAVSWGKQLANMLKAGLKCDAESAASNQRIIRTTKNWLDKHGQTCDELLVIIQWSTWERKEWLIDGEYYQINASGIDHVPSSHQDAYKKFITEIDWKNETEKAHQDIWDFHQYLAQRQVRHVFFNGNNHFETIAQEHRFNWGVSYIDPYNSQMTYHQWLINNGYNTVLPDSWHFGQDAHAVWAQHVLKYIIANKLI